MIDAFWCRYPSQRNFGDWLTPWMIRRVTGRSPRFVKPAPARPVLLGIGSIISLAQPGSTVWGAGILHKNDAIREGVEILAVRGPLTRKRALDAGIACPDAMGDPAILLPRFYTPSRSVARQGVGIIPHYLDKMKVFASMPRCKSLKPIDIQNPVEAVIDAIDACELVASSSLHGIIAAHAYGVPAVWLKFSDDPHGDGVKFHDYFQSIGSRVKKPLTIAARDLNADMLASRCVEPSSCIDIDHLWHNCPFRTLAIGSSA